MEGPLVLIGCMGSGKTSVGKRISEMTGLRFIDLDNEIERMAGKDITHIFKDMGESVFRKLESQALIESLEKKDAIISCGGGVVLDKANLDKLQDIGNVILLTADPSTLAKRLEDDSSRPLLNNCEKENKIIEILKQRSELYLLAADMVIDTTGLTKDEIASIILERE